MHTALQRAGTREGFSPLFKPPAAASATLALRKGCPLSRTMSAAVLLLPTHCTAAAAVYVPHIRPRPRRSWNTGHTSFLRFLFPPSRDSPLIPSPSSLPPLTLFLSQFSAQAASLSRSASAFSYNYTHSLSLPCMATAAAAEASSSACKTS